MLDILGFREMTASQPAQRIARTVERLFEMAPGVTSAWSTLDGQRSGQPLTGHAHFSDTILLWTPVLAGWTDIADRIEIQNLLHVSNLLMLTAFLHGMPLRAGVALGEAYINEEKQAFVGNGIVAAYLTEGAQEWSGGALADGTDDGVVGMALTHRLVTPYPVPSKTRSGLTLMYALNWTEAAQVPERLQKRDHGVSLRGLLRRSMRKYIRASSPDHIMKNRNTDAFIESSLSEGMKEWRSSKVITGG